MKKILWITSCAFLLLTVICSNVWSMDFVSMSNDELFELRGAIQNAPEADKKVYQVEWEKRLASMTDEEKKQFVETPKDGETNDTKLKQPLIPARGYEKQLEQGRVIFGGFPEGGSSSR